MLLSVLKLFSLKVLVCASNFQFNIDDDHCHLKCHTKQKLLIFCNMFPVLHMQQITIKYISSVNWQKKGYLEALLCTMKRQPWIILPDWHWGEVNEQKAFTKALTSYQSMCVRMGSVIQSRKSAKNASPALSWSWKDLQISQKFSKVLWDES